MRSDLCFHNEQLPGPPVRPPTDGPGLAKTQRFAGCANDQTNPSKDLPPYYNDRCVTLLFPHVAAYLASRVRRAEPSHQSQWLHEIKHDGFRVIARLPAASLLARPIRKKPRQRGRG